MRLVIKALAFILILLLMGIQLPPQGQENSAKKDSQLDELSGKPIIKDIRVGTGGRPVLTRSNRGLCF